MAAAWSITALSKKTTVPAATLRYWEHLGLLPRAARTHTGYRMFAGEVLQYIEFVRRSKGGRTPCPEVEQWIRARLVKVEEQIRQLQSLQQQLVVVSHGFRDGSADSDRSGDLCSLIVGLPEEKKFRERNGGEPACFDAG